MQITVHGRLPDPFLKSDGSRMSPDEWWQSRAAVLERVVKTEFGGMPPRPEVVEVEPLNENTLQYCYHVRAGSRERQLTFTLSVARSPEQRIDGSVKYPVLLTGDGCYNNCESDTVDEALRRGYVVARFNRLEIAYDRKQPRSGGIYDIYPDHKDFTAISAWAWGYSAAIDALSQIPFVDTDEIGITGHSRGGKTVLLAAATDERVKYACPNNSGTHGCAPYRYAVSDMDTSDHARPRSEILEDMLENFPHWMGKELALYVGRIDELPYDMHYFGALIAPRYYFPIEGMQDNWGNPNGSRQTYLAVKSCYRYLGCEDHAAAWFRPGGHAHKYPAFEQFLLFMDRARKGLAPATHHAVDPYPAEPLIFDF